MKINRYKIPDGGAFILKLAVDFNIIDILYDLSPCSESHRLVVVEDGHKEKVPYTLIWASKELPDSDCWNYHGKSNCGYLFGAYIE